MLFGREAAQQHAGRRRRAEIPPLGFALAQLAGIYVLAQNATGLVIVDMHAAHERIMYEKLKTALERDRIPTQSLLIPATLRASRLEAAVVEENAAASAPARLRNGGARPEALVVRCVPAPLQDADPAELARDVLARDRRVRRDACCRSAATRCSATMACHAAVRANRSLTHRRDERAAAGDGSDRPFRPVQPRSTDLDPDLDGASWIGCFSAASNVTVIAQLVVFRHRGAMAWQPTSRIASYESRVARRIARRRFC